MTMVILRIKRLYVKVKSDYRRQRTLLGLIGFAGLADDRGQKTDVNKQMTDDLNRAPLPSIIATRNSQTRNSHRGIANRHLSPEH